MAKLVNEYRAKKTQEEKARIVLLPTPIDDAGFKVFANEDGSFTMDWDPQDSKWSWLNGLTQKEIQVIMEQAIKDYLDDLQS